LSNFIRPDLIFYVLTIPFSLVIHEYSHARAADWLGDKTPRMTGRLTLNPLAHLDLLGLLMMLFGPIGWAKPVPISGSNFRHPRMGLLLTAFAGPLSNFILACACFLILKLWPVSLSVGTLALFVQRLFAYGAYVNVILFVFNIVPIPPLDGSRIVSNLLPYKQEMVWRRLEVYGPFLLVLIVILPPVQTHVMYPFFNYAVSIVASWFGLTGL